MVETTTIVEQLPVRPPFDGGGLMAFLTARAVPGVEEGIPGGYRRSLSLPGAPAVVDLLPHGDRVDAILRLGDEEDRPAALAACRRLLDLDRDPVPIAAHLAADPLLGPLVRAAPGRRVAAHPDGRELAVRAVLGQQITVTAATRLAGGLVAGLGTPLAQPVGAVTHMFPSAEAIAALDDTTLPMPRSRARTLVRIAAEMAAGRLVLDDGADLDATRAQLLALPGIGPWTAGYIAMRALRDPDAFPPGDAGVRHGLCRLGWTGGDAELTRLAEPWRPYRAYAVQHLWALAA